MRTKYEMFKILDNPIKDRTGVAYSFPKVHQYLVSWYSMPAVTFSPTTAPSLQDSLRKTIVAAPSKSLRQVLNREKWDSLYVTGRKV